MHSKFLLSSCLLMSGLSQAASLEESVPLPSTIAQRYWRNTPDTNRWSETETRRVVCICRK